MKRSLKIAAVAFACAWMSLEVSSVMAGKKSMPAPPPPVLCGCACPDGSIVITHAPDAESCPSVCASACDQTM